MGLFNRHRRFYYVVKLFKITNQQSAAIFPMDKLLLRTIEHLQNLTGLNATGFNLNYTKDYNTLNSFKQALVKLPQIVYGSVGFGDDDRNCFFNADNAMINYGIRPENSSVDISIKLAEEYFQIETVLKTSTELIDKFNFEYGYIQRFPVRRGFFSPGGQVTELNHLWTFHSVGLNYGYIKNIYNCNFLNKSHFENTDLKVVLEKFGVKRPLSQNMILWTISDEEIEILKATPEIKKRIIQIKRSENEFLKSDDAKKFYARMRLQHMETIF